MPSDVCHFCIMHGSLLGDMVAATESSARALYNTSQTAAGSTLYDCCVIEGL